MNDILENLNPWYVEIEVKGLGKTIPGKPPKGQSYPKGERSTLGLINHQKYRQGILVEQPKKFIDFKGKKVLELACNCGYWAHQYYKEGCSEVIGIEGRDLFIEQANLLFKHNCNDIPYNFIKGNVLSDDTWKDVPSVDFILCAGLFYHIDDHQKVMDYMCEKSNYILIETRVQPKSEIQVEPEQLLFNGIENRVKRVPSEKFLTKYMKKKGYVAHKMNPDFPTMEGLNGKDDFNTGRRLAILFIKENS